VFTDKESMGIQIPLFPLGLLPLPDELVPLHIFEPRYRQLLEDMESDDIDFGIYCTHSLNEVKLGSLMKLESVLKRYPSGEADIIVRCTDVFTMDKMFRMHKTKMYPGADVTLLKADKSALVDSNLYRNFLELLKKRNISKHVSVFNIYQIAVELNLDLFDRYTFLCSNDEKKLAFISSQVRFQLHISSQEEKSKDVFHLN
jgi:uncharacterized protein